MVPSARMTDLWRFLSESFIEKLQKIYGRDFIDYNRFLLRGSLEKRNFENSNILLLRFLTDLRIRVERFWMLAADLDCNQFPFPN